MLFLLLLVVLAACRGPTTMFDTATGCCVYLGPSGLGEGAPPSYSECPDTGEHADAICCATSTGEPIRNCEDSGETG